MEQIEKFRKVPVIIEAIQFLKNDDINYKIKLHEFLDEVSYNYVTIIDPSDNKWQRIDIDTLRGTIKVHLNEWIIKESNGELYVCEPNFFKKTYEEVK